MIPHINEEWICLQRDHRLFQRNQQPTIEYSSVIYNFYQNFAQLLDATSKYTLSIEFKEDQIKP